MYLRHFLCYLSPCIFSCLFSTILYSVLLISINLTFQTKKVFLHTIHETVIFVGWPVIWEFLETNVLILQRKLHYKKVVFECLISYTDAYQYISQYVCDLWQREWDTAVTNKLHATKPLCPDLLFERSQMVVITVIDQNHYA